ncbi:glycosyltransferase [Novipirellula artificiosorum]|uniref:Glycosyl transferases group 1 n=1 Tax=Novipirellula artificiosorum TaxID=2528016 RepID=A0A5C6E3R8_9BACT|nr:glycosyltransferase [Novipirellula artificiosorum]TWU41849.1 hypothetical protein Poly41_01410 [Novipirellula artificiosorum]
MHDPTPRLLLFDDNIHSLGGHFLELASLLIQGAKQLGYTTCLATHHSFKAFDSVDFANEVFPVFRVRRMVEWSLGVDGRSKVRRKVDGSSVGGSWMENQRQALRGPLSRHERRPQVMLHRWSQAFFDLLSHWQVDSRDTLVVNTGDDFVLLALATALAKRDAIDPDATPLTIHIVFHFGVYDPITTEQRKRQFGAQVNDTLRQMASHHLHLHATTHSLTSQLKQVGVSVTPIPYPTRYRPPSLGSCDPSGRRKIVLAGTPRPEKGRHMIPELLSTIHHPYLSNGEYQMSMQMPARRWKRMIPVSMRPEYRRASAADSQSVASPSKGLFEIKPSDMPATDYHRWLDTADVGLFLYEPERYVARCSGVLLEMLIRGVPVIVPNRCWLADQVREAGGEGSVGYIYNSLDQIPEILDRLGKDYESIRRQSIQYASEIARRHASVNTLRQMGIADARQVHLHRVPLRPTTNEFSRGLQGTHACN